MTDETASDRLEAHMGGEGAIERARELRGFLSGACPLEGVWFGELHPDKPGAFWWRVPARETIDALITAARSPPTQDERPVESRADYEAYTLAHEQRRELNTALAEEAATQSPDERLRKALEEIRLRAANFSGSVANDPMAAVSEIHSMTNEALAAALISDARIETYESMHEIAVELGYPSILEALEDLDRLKSAVSDKPNREVLEQIDALLDELIGSKSSLFFYDIGPVLEGKLRTIGLIVRAALLDAPVSDNHPGYRNREELSNADR